MPEILTYSGMKANMPTSTTLAKPVPHDFSPFRQWHPRGPLRDLAVAGDGLDATHVVVGRADAEDGIVHVLYSTTTRSFFPRILRFRPRRSSEKT